MRSIPVFAASVLLAGSALYSTCASAAGQIDCEMKFNLTGWAAIYKHAEGHGTITCNNGRSFNVDIVAVGGGLTAGKYKVEGGTGITPYARWISRWGLWPLWAIAFVATVVAWRGRVARPRA